MFSVASGAGGAALVVGCFEELVQLSFGRRAKGLRQAKECRDDSLAAQIANTRIVPIFNGGTCHSDSTKRVTNGVEPAILR